MISQKYKDAYKEVLEIIKYLPENELSRIPKEKIEYFRRNQNENHVFNFDGSIALEEQNISREANAIILNLINDYFFNDEKREKLAQLLKSNENEYQEELREKYQYDHIFQNKANELKNDNEDINNENKTEMIKYEKKNFFEKIFEKIKQFFSKSNK